MRSNVEMIRRSTIIFIDFLAYLIKISGFFSMFGLKNVLFAPLSLLVGGVCIKNIVLAGPGEELSFIL